MSARIIPESSPNAGQRRNCGSTPRVAGFRLTIFCAKQWTGSKKPNPSARPVTTMRFCGGTPARASSNETNSWLAKKKNESNFLSSNCTRFAGGLLGGAYASYSEAATGRHLYNRAGAARARASRATKTVIAGHDLAIFERIWVDLPQKDRPPIVPLHPELLIEIAVINFTTPPT